MAKSTDYGSPMTEKQLQASVVKLARLLGWKAFHQYDSRRSEPGWPDLVLLRRHRMIFAELKTAKGRVSPAQRDTIADLRTVARSIQTGNVEVHVWRPADWLAGDIEATLR